MDDGALVKEIDSQNQEDSDEELEESEEDLMFTERATPEELKESEREEEKD